MPTSEFSDVFVSYRRKDVEFVKKLVNSLQAEEKEVWVDWEDIPPGVEGFADEIKRGLEGADAFIAVLSPDYLESTYCVDMELAYAVQMNKKVVPIVLRKFDGYEIPQGIGHINWIYFTPHAGQENTYEESFPKIMEVLNSDLEHVKLHKRFLLRAIEWEQNDKDRSFLLSGEEIANGQSWLTDAAGKEPLPTELHKAYIMSSEANRQRQQRMILAGVTVALVISIVLAILSLIGFNDASNAQSTAVANLNVASTAQSEAEANENIASTARANAEISAELAQTAQAAAESNEAQALAAQAEAEKNLQQARQSQSLFHGDLAQQQANRHLHQRALLLGLESLKFERDGITSNSAFQAIHSALHQPVKKTMNLFFPQGATLEIWHETEPYVLIAHTDDYDACFGAQDCVSLVEIWDTVTKEKRVSLSHEAIVSDVYWNQPQNQVLTLMYDERINQSTLILWSLDTQTEIYRQTINGYVGWLQWQSEHQLYLVAQQATPQCSLSQLEGCDYQLNIYDWDSGDIFKTFSLDAPVTGAYISQTQQFIEIDTLTSNGLFNRIYDLETNEVSFTYQMQSNAFVTLAWRDNDTRVIGLHGLDVVSHDLLTGEERYRIAGLHSVEVVGDMIIGTVPNIENEDCLSCVNYSIYSSVTGEYLMTTSHEHHNIRFVRALDDGDHFLTATRDSATCVDCVTEFYLWSASRDEIVATFDYDGWIEEGDGGYDISPDGKYLLIYAKNFVEHYLVSVWDLTDGSLHLDLDLDRDVAVDVHFDSTNHYLVVHHGESVVLYDFQTGYYQYQLGHVNSINHLEIHRDVNQLITWTDQNLIVWEVADWMPTLTNPAGIRIVGGAYNENITRYLTWSNNEQAPNEAPHAYIWDVESGHLIRILETESPVYLGVWNPDDSQVVVAQRNDACQSCFNGVTVFDSMTGDVLAEYPQLTRVNTFQWIPQTSRLIVQHGEQVSIIDMDQVQVVYFSDQYAPHPDEWNHTYSQFVHNSQQDDLVYIVDVATDQIVQSFSLDSTYYNDVAWMLDDRVLVFANANPSTMGGDLVGYSVEDARELFRIPNILSFEPSHDGQSLAVFSDDHHVRVVDVTTGEIRWSELTFEGRWIFSWSPDNQYLLMAQTFEDTAILYNAITGEHIHELQPINIAHLDADLLWRPDSKMIFVHLNQGGAINYNIFDLVLYSNYVSFYASSQPIWRPNGETFVTHDGVWSVDFGDLIQRGEALKIRELTDDEQLEFFIKPPPEKITGTDGG